MNGLNFSDASDIRLGSSAITALYYGSTLLWPLKRDYSKEYLTIEALSDATVLFYKNSDKISRTIQYSKDKTNWTSVNFNIIENAPSVNITKGEKLYLKGNNSSYCIDYPDHKYCAINISEGVGNIYGNIMSLIYSDNFYGQTVLDTPYSFVRLFNPAYYNDIIDASNLILPATTLSEFCYTELFRHCKRLTVGPKLPATTLSTSCYSHMFSLCTNLVNAPELHATTLSESCYRSMFSGCKSLTSAPELPATTLSTSCYSNMFNGCTSLTTAPELPATTLSTSCYSHMFSGCTSLTTAPELPATTLESSCYWNMFSGCTSLATAPELPATTLESSCYQYMFDNCYNLNYIKCLATNNISINTCLDWTNGVASTGTFIKSASATDWETGTSGIPSGWTVQDAS